MLLHSRSGSDPNGRAASRGIPKQETEPALKPSKTSPNKPTQKIGTTLPRSMPQKALGHPSSRPETAIPTPSAKPVTSPQPSPTLAKKPSEKSAVTPFEISGKVVITLTGIPEGASITVNRKSSRTPFTVPRSDKAVKVEVRLPGYENAVRRVVPLADKTVRIHLKKE